MNPLLGLFAAPSAIAALDAAGSAASAVTRPFADVLSSLAEHMEPTAPISATGDENDELDERVAARLQEVVESCDAQAGDCSSVRYDSATDEVEINNGSPSSDAVRAAIEADEQLMDDLRQMAAIDAADDGRLELLVQIA